MRKLIGQEHEKKIVELFGKMKQEDIAKEVGFSASTVSRILGLHGLVDTRRKSKINDEAREKIVELTKEGLLRREVAEIIGCSIASVSRILSKYDFINDMETSVEDTKKYKVPVACRCPKCGVNHIVIMYYTGHLPARIYCDRHLYLR